MIKATPTTFICLLLFLFPVTLTASNIRGGDRGLDMRAADFEEERTDLLSSSSAHIAAKCPFGGGTVNFNVRTSVIPSLRHPTCDDEKRMSIGAMISAALLKAGIATYTQSVFLAGVCNTPIVESNRMNETSIGTNETSIGASQTSIGANQTIIGTNETSIGASQTSIGANQTIIGTNETSIGTNETSIGANQTIIGTNETSIGENQNKTFFQPFQPVGIGFIWTGGGVGCNHLDIGHHCPMY